MKGRTNITDGIFLNATTEQKTVKSGETIVAGDFVNYSNTSAKLDLGTINKPNKIRFISEDRVLMRFGNTLSLVELDGVDTNIIASCPFEIVDYDGDASGRIVVITKQTVSPYTTYIRGYKIADDEFVLVNSVTITNYADSYIYLVGNNIITFGYSSAGAGKPTYTCTATIDDTGRITKGNEFSDTSSTTYRSDSMYASLIKVGNRLCTTAVISGNPVTYKLATIYVLGSEPKISLSTYSSTHGFVYLCEKDSTHAYAYSNEGMAIVNITNGDVTLYPFHNFEAHFQNCYVIADNIILFEKENTFSIAQMNDSSQTTELISNTYGNSDIYSGGSGSLTGAHSSLFTYDGQIYAIAGENVGTHQNKIFVMEYTDDYSQISGIMDINEVERWKNNLKPIGVAKDGGTGGDTISVYIPSSQY